MYSPSYVTKSFKTKRGNKAQTEKSLHGGGNEDCRNYEEANTNCSEMKTAQGRNNIKNTCGQYRNKLQEGWMD